MGIAWSYQDPFEGVAESGITSNVIDLRDVHDWTLSWYTTSGATSSHTIQLSNASNTGLDSGDIPEAAWSNWTEYAGSWLSRTITPPLGVRWGRILREASGASVQNDVARQILN